MKDKIPEWIRSRGLGEVALLRDQVGGLERRPSSDWDIVVTDLRACQEGLRSTFGPSDLTIDRAYVSQNFVAGEQVDFFERFEWNGYCFLSMEVFWAGVSVSDDGIPRPSVGHDALIVLFVGLLGGGTFSERYVPLIEMALKSDEERFVGGMEWAVGREASSQVIDFIEKQKYDELVGLAKILRRALKKKRLGEGVFGCLGALGRHWWIELQYHLSPPFPWIAFLGPDGAGKSTVIDGISADLEKRRLHTKRIHWRPNFVKSSDSPPQLVNDPHAIEPRGFFGSCVKLCYISVDWLYSHYFPLRHLRAKNKMILSDRFYLDLLADPRRYRYGAGRRIASFFFRFLPRPDLIVVLIGDPKTLYERKREVAEAEVARQVEAYRKIACEQGSRACLIDSTQAISEVKLAVWKEVMKAYSNRSYLKYRSACKNTKIVKNCE